MSLPSPIEESELINITDDDIVQGRLPSPIEESEQELAGILSLWRNVTIAHRGI